jgi:pyruvate dehydrogenase E1 component alpha subunit/2-oxoisovalerate dehydrogenase E1 component alpha subunit
MYAELVRLRALDERMMAMQREGRIGYYRACSGQEAAPVAVGLAVAQSDWVFPALREAGTMLVRGFPLTTFIAQLFGNAKDVLKGRQMPSYMSGRAVHQVSWSACVGTQLLHAVGVAWAAKLAKDPIVTVGFLGDGATSTSDFHAAMNFAALFAVPAVLVCQNNRIATSVPVTRQTASPTLAEKADAYGMPGVRTDGGDVLSAYGVIKDAIEAARGGSGPTFIELVTCPLPLRSTSDDPTHYRPKDLPEQDASADPIARLSETLASRGLLSDDDARRIVSEASDEISRAIAEVETAPRPDASSMFEDVYAEMPWHLEEQWQMLRANPPRPR